MFRVSPGIALLFAAIACAKTGDQPESSSNANITSRTVVVSSGDSVVVTGGDSVVVTGGDTVVVTGGDTTTVATKPAIKCHFVIDWTQPAGTTRKRFIVLTCGPKAIK